MTIALIILALLFALQTVRVWIYRRLTKRAVQLNSELLEMNADLEKTLAGARTIAKIAAKGMREEGESEWPEFIEKKVS